MEEIINAVFERFQEVRYMAIYHEKTLIKLQRETDLIGASASDSDTYEELIVNPVLLKAATQRGEIDCGGLDYLTVNYGNFRQLVKSTDSGHWSICIENSADLNTLPNQIFSFIEEAL